VLVENGRQKWNQTTGARILKSNDQVLISDKTVTCGGYLL
jgi:hypothetical protein